MTAGLTVRFLVCVVEANPLLSVTVKVTLTGFSAVAAVLKVTVGFVTVEVETDAPPPANVHAYFKGVLLSGSVPVPIKLTVTVPVLPRVTVELLAGEFITATGG